MDVGYSSLDIIEKYNLVFSEFIIDEEKYDTNNNNRKLIDIVGGVGLTNSIHEMFVKCIVSEYGNLYTLSNTKKNLLIKYYKSPKAIKYFASDLNLNLEEAFNLEKAPIQSKYAYIINVENLLSMISEHRELRNNYLHGDFDFEDNISYELYCENITRFQEMHNFVFKIFRYGFNKNIDCLPEYETIITVIEKRKRGHHGVYE